MSFSPVIVYILLLSKLNPINGLLSSKGLLFIISFLYFLPLFHYIELALFAYYIYHYWLLLVIVELPGYFDLLEFDELSGHFDLLEFVVEKE